MVRVKAGGKETATIEKTKTKQQTTSLLMAVAGGAAGAGAHQYQEQQLGKRQGQERQAVVPWCALGRNGVQQQAAAVRCSERRWGQQLVLDGRQKRRIAACPGGRRKRCDFFLHIGLKHCPAKNPTASKTCCCAGEDRSNWCVLIDTF